MRNLCLGNDTTATRKGNLCKNATPENRRWSVVETTRRCSRKQRQAARGAADYSKIESTIISS